MSEINFEKNYFYLVIFATFYSLISMEKAKSLVEPRKELFETLYLKGFPATCQFIKKMGGNLDDARDVFQDALVIYYEKKISSPDFNISHDVSYLLGICRHLWFQKHKQNERLVSLEKIAEPRMNLNEEPKVSEQLLNYLEASGKKCMDLLKAFYYDQLNMKDLALRFGFSGERSATAQKFKCLEKIRNSVKEKSLIKADFYE